MYFTDFDYKIFLQTDFNTSLARGLKRTSEKEFLGSQEKIRAQYQTRYIPGQQLYLDSALPEQQAQCVVDNSNYTEPTILKGP